MLHRTLRNQILSSERGNRDDFQTQCVCVFSQAERIDGGLAPLCSKTYRLMSGTYNLNRTGSGQPGKVGRNVNIRFASPTGEP